MQVCHSDYLWINTYGSELISIKNYDLEKRNRCRGQEMDAFLKVERESAPVDLFAGCLVSDGEKKEDESVGHENYRFNTTTSEKKGNGKGCGVQ